VRKLSYMPVLSSSGIPPHHCGLYLQMSPSSSDFAGRETLAWLRTQLTVSIMQEQTLRDGFGGRFVAMRTIADGFNPEAFLSGSKAGDVKF
jgi:hypothetical protein